MALNTQGEAFAEVVAARESADEAVLEAEGYIAQGVQGEGAATRAGEPRLSRAEPGCLLAARAEAKSARAAVADLRWKLAERDEEIEMLTQRLIEAKLSEAQARNDGGEMHAAVRTLERVDEADAAARAAAAEIVLVVPKGARKARASSLRLTTPSGACLWVPLPEPVVDGARVRVKLHADQTAALQRPDLIALSEGAFTSKPVAVKAGSQHAVVQNLVVGTR